ncbi:MAG: DMT family transporter [Acuticoccus sp.]
MAAAPLSPAAVPMPPRAIAMDGVAWAMLVLLAVLWGGSFVLVEVILTALPVMTLVALRVLLAACTLWMVVLALGLRLPRQSGIYARFLVLGLFNNAVPFLLIVWGQTAITAGLAAILNVTTPLFAALIAGVFLADERLTRTRVGGIVLGLMGVTVMIGPAALLTLGQDVMHQLAVVGASLSYGISAVYARRFLRLDVPPLIVATGQLTASSLILVPTALLVDGVAFVGVPAGVWVAVLANACLSTALAYILYFRIVARAGATNATLVTVLVPVVAILVGALVLGERLGAPQFAGMALIFAGLMVIDGRLLRRRRAAT